MKPTPLQAFAKSLSLRRKELGISQSAISRLSGLSLPTVKRIMAGKLQNVGFGSVVAVTNALGLTVDLVPVADATEIRNRCARRKAEALVKLVQGSAALESQALDRATLGKMTDRTARELLAGPRSRLWSDIE